MITTAYQATKFNHILPLFLATWSSLHCQLGLFILAYNMDLVETSCAAGMQILYHAVQKFNRKNFLTN